MQIEHRGACRCLRGSDRCLRTAALRGHAVLIGLAALTLAMPGNELRAEDGYELWLRNAAVESADLNISADQSLYVVDAAGASPIARTAVTELLAGLSATAGREVETAATIGDGALVIGTPASSEFIASLDLTTDELGDEGYVIRALALPARAVTVIAANTDRGLLYGSFALLRLLHNGGSLSSANIVSAPKIGLRVLNHWDNLDGHVERGYSGRSIWDWWRLPDIVSPRYTDYARANASIGINGTVLNNVNAQPEILESRYLAKVASIADVLRPYGMRAYISVRFSSPVDIGGLATADPLDDDVRRWWQQKADEIYAAIPDFGGFLVKANSEGQPGPQNYGRSHVDGANMLAAALQPHGGIVMWRAFVYSEEDPEDRVKQAYTEFKPYDGEFADNVLVQVKNGPLDFQPREPFHPLFGAMPATPLMLEFQITQEYLGFSTHLAYLGEMYEEVLDADTAQRAQGATVADVVDGSLHGNPLTGIAGVANIGSDRNWSGSPFAQSNWYAFGRLAWDPRLSSRDIAEEWLQQTFSRDPDFVAAAADMMMRSREAVVDYMTPLGLAHLMGTGHHYGPAPWVDELARPEWNPYYYHRSSADGIGLDRTESGSNAIAQYAAPLRTRYADVATTPDELLLWFHRLPWDYEMRSGKTLWQELVGHYDRGVAEVQRMQEEWRRIGSYVDKERAEEVADFLAIQAREARWWRDACIAYFRNVSGKALPPGTREPEESLDYYRGLEFPYAPGN